MSARKRVRAFLEAPSIHPTPKPNELLTRRWISTSTGDTETRNLRVSDLSELLRSERSARRQLREQKSLANARQDGPNTVRELREGLARAEDRNATQAETLPSLREWNRVRAELADLHKQNQDKARALDAAEQQTPEEWDALQAELRKQQPEGTLSYLRNENRKFRAELATAERQRKILQDSYDAASSLSKKRGEELAELKRLSSTRELLQTIAENKSLMAKLDETEANLKKALASRNIELTRTGLQQKTISGMQESLREKDRRITALQQEADRQRANKVWLDFLQKSFSVQELADALQKFLR